MPSLASGCSCCTAWASTCAAECRITLRPSSVSARDRLDVDVGVRGPGEVAQRAVGVADDDDGLGPVVGRPASRTAAPAVVPAGTRTGAEAGRAAGWDCLSAAGEDTGASRQSTV